ncbi:MAG: S-layer homology domain-containing protein [bacterium]|nr:S-layer homology domain-containing protein [bacterium]MYD03449.1 S-layer homology domain-containing protein [Acidimicrobiia bacterium]MCY3579771.1 S-layer homology domain-containing protein [bacterium]MCY3652282.1 S-layer homology domain-containing protein [bacterium]MDE0643112.1 S-layer homology domain-containing protein [bacterium]
MGSIRPASLKARLSVVGTATLLVLSLLAAAPPLPAAEGGFSDVTGGSHAPAINALAELGVFDGTECGDDLFCPRQPIERRVMAVWLVRVLGESPSASTFSRFADVDASAWWSPYAEHLAVKSITAGCKTGPLRFCPDESVTRGQMATFLVRAFQLPPAAGRGFVDTSGTIHAANINALAAAGVTTGCHPAPLRFCPGQPVTRAQMATFLHRALPEATQPVEISAEVPDAEVTDIPTGEIVNFRSLIKGDTAVLLWFWAHW